MKYATNTVWKHENPIDWEGMQKEMDISYPNALEGTTVAWFKIDEQHHGSQSVYPREEAYKKFKAELSEYRKEAST